MKYRRRIWSSVWHLCGNCSHWPSWPYFEREREMAPTYGTLCDECVSKRKRGQCFPSGSVSAKAGSSHVVTLWTIVSAVLVSMWAPFLLLAQSAVTVDVGAILTALTPIIVACGIGIQMFATAKAKAATKEVHTLVNDQMTREKESRLFEMQLSRVTLSRLVHDTTAPEEQIALDTLDKRIASLQEEITARDAIAETLPSSAAKAP